MAQLKCSRPMFSSTRCPVMSASLAESYMNYCAPRKPADQAGRLLVQCLTALQSERESFTPPSSLMRCAHFKRTTDSSLSSGFTDQTSPGLRSKPNPLVPSQRSSNSHLPIWRRSSNSHLPRGRNHHLANCVVIHRASTLPPRRSGAR